MSTDIWNLDRDLCRCCHSEGDFNDLAESCYLADQKENYSDMIKDCIDILIHPVPGVLAEVTFKICSACIQRLKDALDFKRQVQACEEKFQRYYDWNAIKVNNDYKVSDIKEETTESLPVENGKCPDIKDEGSETMSDWNEDFTNADVEDIIIEEREWNQEEPSSEEGNNYTMEEGAVRVGDNLTKKRIKKTMRREKKRVKKKTKKTPLKQSLKDSLNDGMDIEKESLKGTKASRQRKFRVSTGDYRRVGGVNQCAHCDKKYDKMSSLRFHLKSKHYKIPRYFCDICQKQFMTLAPYTVHKLEEHGIDDRFNCQACKGRFNTQISLRKHINNFHMLGEKFKCESCDYESFSFESLYKHKFKHRSEKNFHCRFCKKSFLRKTTLDLHERIHTGDRRKVCKICSQAFVQKASLNYHMGKYHPGVSF